MVFLLKHDYTHFAIFLIVNDVQTRTFSKARPHGTDPQLLFVRGGVPQ